MKKKKTSKKEMGLPKWNLKLLFDSPEDPRIEKDISELEKACQDFAAKYDTANKTYLESANELEKVLKDYENLAAKFDSKAFVYFYLLKDIESANTKATANIALLSNRLAKCDNTITFFKISLGNISSDKQKEYLASPNLSHFKVFLKRIFDDASHTLSLPEEKVMNLKGQVCHSMWVSGNERLLSSKLVPWKGKDIPFAEAHGLLLQLSKKSDRDKLAQNINDVLKSVAPFAEAEVNAVVTNKKIDDELRHFKTPYEATILNYRNMPEVVENLVNTVTRCFDIPRRFMKIKAKLLKQKTLSYADRLAEVGKVKSEIPFNEAVRMLTDIYNGLNPRFAEIFQKFLKEGQIDAPPRQGKRSGAYCMGTYGNPTFVLLNHMNDLETFNTFAHEMGHAFHSELSKQQGPLYSDYSTSLAETASTLFESIARDTVTSKLSGKEQIVALHDKIDDNVATIFRQVACFNFEKEIHETVRSKGFMSKEELSTAHNKHMSSYLGPAFKLTPDDGYFFVQWGHIRRFFYVYSYAYGMLVSKAMIRRYKADNTFWKSIEQFLLSGGKASPEEILMEIGMDVTQPDFFEEGLREIEEDIVRLERMVK